MITENPTHSLFKRNEITSISEIFELYLFFDINQEIVNKIIYQSAVFLHQIKEIDPQLLEKNFNMIFDFRKKGTYISVSGINLISSLWIIGVYPENPKKLINKTVYKNGDFTYRFNTKTKNLVLTKKKTNERKPANHTRNLKIS